MSINHKLYPPCVTCGGTGEYKPAIICEHCGGNGYTTLQRTKKLKKLKKGIQK